MWGDLVFFGIYFWILSLFNSRWRGCIYSCLWWVSEMIFRCSLCFWCCRWWGWCFWWCWWCLEEVSRWCRLLLLWLLYGWFIFGCYFIGLLWVIVCIIFLFIVGWIWNLGMGFGGYWVILYVVMLKWWMRWSCFIFGGWI